MELLLDICVSSLCKGHCNSLYCSNTTRDVAKAAKNTVLQMNLPVMNTSAC